MKIIYSRQHLSHEPERMYDLSTGDFIPHYEESERGEIIFRHLVNNNFDEIISPEEIDFKELEAIHDKDFLSFFQQLSEKNVNGLIPESFSNIPILGRPSSFEGLLGYYCTDIQTPLSDGTLSGLIYAASAAMTGAKLLTQGEKNAYALTRPPGHHAGKKFFGGFCYCNNAALAAEFLSRQAKTALLDLDCHHGNGSQDIFYDKDSVYFLSLHEDPNSAYPYYSGYAEETGTGKGLNFNKNYPLAPGSGSKEYMTALNGALDTINKYKPGFLVVSLGVDTYKEDPIGTLKLDIADFRNMGEKIGALKIPVLVVQEGGYNKDELGECVSEFLSGLADIN